MTGGGFRMLSNAPIRQRTPTRSWGISSLPQQVVVERNKVPVVGTMSAARMASTTGHKAGSLSSGGFQLQLDRAASMLLHGAQCLGQGGDLLIFT